MPSLLNPSDDTQSPIHDQPPVGHELEPDYLYETTSILPELVGS
jgi:hypothetical protein